MPKEFIHNRYFGKFARELCSEDHDHEEDSDNCKDKQVALDSSVIKVGWSKETEHCEIAVLPDPDKEHDLERTWYSQFDRQGLNRLIKVLRQARDDAFGKDE